MKRSAGNWKDRLVGPRLHTSSIACLSTGGGADGVVFDPVRGTAEKEVVLGQVPCQPDDATPPDPIPPGSGVRNEVEPAGCRPPPPKLHPASSPASPTSSRRLRHIPGTLHGSGRAPPVPHRSFARSPGPRSVSPYRRSRGSFATAADSPDWRLRARLSTASRPPNAKDGPPGRTGRDIPTSPRNTEGARQPGSEAVSAFPSSPPST